jgi:cyclophilin family peptidyl-prolyl cis-trans isomerase
MIIRIRRRIRLMHRLPISGLCATLVGLTLAAFDAQSAALTPLPGKEDNVPKITQAVTVQLQTTAGAVTIEVYPEAAPNAAARFVELVESGFYDNTPISRVVPGFVAQFGINWREPHKQWQNRNFDDDPSLFALERGTLAFAKAGPNTNSTQVFINYTENNRLASPQYNFTTFGKVVDGMDVVDQFVQAGDPSGGLDQGRLWANGDAYIDSLDVKPTMIVRASVVE